MILLLLMFVPFCVAMLTLVSPSFEAWQARQPVKLTSWLNPAPLSRGHRMFGDRCSTCHQKAFRAVTDDACTTCHTQTLTHVAYSDRLGARHVDIHCVDCHAMHSVKEAMTEMRSVPCVECHEKNGRQLAENRDFGKAHATFRLAFIRGDKTLHVREDQSPLPLEQSHLKFSHEVHMKQDGVSSPEGQTVLDCVNCHQLEESGRRFATPTMTGTCQQSGCHALRFDRPLSGVVPHGTAREVTDRTRNAYANWLADNSADAGLACGWKTSRTVTHRQLLDCAERVSGEYLNNTLFKQRGDDLGCALCHELVATNMKDVPLTIAPILVQHHWHESAQFPHDMHKSAKCTDCHNKTSSKSASDVSIPGLAKCRECHVGQQGYTEKVSSGCADCHNYHRVKKDRKSNGLGEYG
ncbi:MAG: hypothetical protein K9J42_07590 [Sulfuritalea sp.]|nr:hypothetical protein [Sulfuritalea sp.]